MGVVVVMSWCPVSLDLVMASVIVCLRDEMLSGFVETFAVCCRLLLSVSVAVSCGFFWFYCSFQTCCPVVLLQGFCRFHALLLSGCLCFPVSRSVRWQCVNRV